MSEVEFRGVGITVRFKLIKNTRLFFTPEFVDVEFHCKLLKCPCQAEGQVLRTNLYNV